MDAFCLECLEEFKAYTHDIFLFWENVSQTSPSFCPPTTIASIMLNNREVIDVRRMGWRKGHWDSVSSWMTSVVQPFRYLVYASLSYYILAFHHFRVCHYPELPQLWNWSSWHPSRSSMSLFNLIFFIWALNSLLPQSEAHLPYSLSSLIAQNLLYNTSSLLHPRHNPKHGYKSFPLPGMLATWPHGFLLEKVA